MLHQVLGLAKNAKITSQILTRVIDKAFSGHEPEIRDLVHKVAALPNENRSDLEFFDEIWTCACLGTNGHIDENSDKAKKLVELLFGYVVTRFDDHRDVALLQDAVTQAIGLDGLVAVHCDALACILESSPDARVQLIAATALPESEAGLEKLWNLAVMGKLPQKLIQSLVARAFLKCDAATQDHIASLIQHKSSIREFDDRYYVTTLFDPLWETRRLPQQDVLHTLSTLTFEHWRVLDGQILWETMLTALRFYDSASTFPDTLVSQLKEIIEHSAHKRTKLLGLRLLAKYYVLSSQLEDDRCDYLIQFAESCGLHYGELLTELAAAGHIKILNRKYLDRVLGDEATCEAVFKALSPYIASVDEWKSALKLLGLNDENAARYLTFNPEIVQKFLSQDPVGLALVLLDSTDETQFRLLLHREKGNVGDIILQELENLIQQESPELPAWLVKFVETLCAPSHSLGTHVSTFLEEIFLRIEEVPARSFADMARKIGVKCGMIPKNLILAYPNNRDENRELWRGLTSLGVTYLRGRFCHPIIPRGEKFPLLEFSEAVIELMTNRLGGLISVEENFNKFLSPLFSNLDNALVQTPFVLIKYGYEIAVPKRWGPEYEEIFFPDVFRLFILGDFLRFVRSDEKCPCFAILSIEDSNARLTVWNLLAQHPRVAFWLVNYYAYRLLILNRGFEEEGYLALQGYEINPTKDHKFICNMIKALRYGADVLLNLEDGDEYVIKHGYTELLSHYLSLVFNGFSLEELVSNVQKFLLENPDQIEEFIDTLDAVVRLNLTLKNNLIKRVCNYWLAAVASLLVVKEVHGSLEAQKIEAKFGDLYKIIRDRATVDHSDIGRYLRELIDELDKI